MYIFLYLNIYIWQVKKNTYILYGSTYVTFSRWQNYVAEAVIYGCWGGKGDVRSGVIVKASTRKVLCVCVLPVVVEVEAMNSNPTTKIDFNLPRDQAK